VERAVDRQSRRIDVPLGNVADRTTERV